MHLPRRNFVCGLLLFNKETEGLTQGASSPHRPCQLPLALDALRFGRSPGQPLRLRAGAGARFVARGIDVLKDLGSILEAAHAGKGTAFVEIYRELQRLQ